MSTDVVVSSETAGMPYVCVHCSTPCPALYRRLSVSLSSIKASTCSNCQKVVDPYIEREWLLVVIDCILLREEAYRHVLYNLDELKTLSKLGTVQVVLVWTLVDVYLSWETLMVEEVHKSDVSTEKPLLRLHYLCISSILGLALRWFIPALFLTKQEHQMGCRTKLFWAILLPSTFSIATLFVGIWENSKIVRMLGSLLIACSQWVAISTVTSDIKMPIIGLLADVSWKLLLPILWLHRDPFTVLI